jgi:hypothetical protein
LPVKLRKMIRTPSMTTVSFAGISLLLDYRT